MTDPCFMNLYPQDEKINGSALKAQNLWELMKQDMSDLNDQTVHPKITLKQAAVSTRPTEIFSTTIPIT